MPQPSRHERKALWTLGAELVRDCAMSPLPPESVSVQIPLSWSGSDSVGEVDFYTVLVSVNGSSFAPLIRQTRERESTFRGENGNTYSFQCVATDTAGNAKG